MKRTRVMALCMALACLFALSACGTPAPGQDQDGYASPSPSQTAVLPFGTNDLNVLGLTIGQSTFDEAKQTLGDGYEEDSYTLGVDHSKWKSLISDAVTFSFSKQGGAYLLAHVNITDASVAAPRETRVGDSVESVRQKFPQNEPPVVEDDLTVLYRANANTQTGVSVPPCGLDSGQQLAYYAPAGAYEFEINDETAVQKFDLSTDKNYALFYEITDNAVTAIYLRYGSDQDPV